jgi:hypothetical protein
MDHLTSLAEKGKRMPEHDIWQVGWVGVRMTWGGVQGPVVQQT